MSLKKLQAEIDRVLKKVSEGVETFDAISDKMQNTSNHNQKEKYEQDLKKEIKKLQRLRDQIKTWISSNDVKDKTALIDNRKLIESLMERFKNVEREIKTKAFSKEGLLQRERLDPKEKEKADVSEWICNTVDELSRQIEMAEAEVETLQGSSRKGKKDHAKIERTNELEHYIERDRWHIGRLELILRLLENDQIAPERVLAIQDDVQYYVECNQEPDFEEDEFIYEDLNLEEEEEMYNVITDDHYAPEDKETEERVSSLKKKLKEKEEEAEIPIPTPSTPKAARSKSLDDSTATTAANSPKKPTTVANVKSPESSNGSVTSPTSVTPKAAQAPTKTTDTTINEKGQTPKITVPSAWAEPIKLADQIKSATESKSTPQTDNKITKHAPSNMTATSVNTSVDGSPPKTSSAPGAPTDSLSNIPPPYPPQKPDSSLLAKNLDEELSISELPNSLSDLVASFEAIKAKASASDYEDSQYMNRMLDASLQFVPDLMDSERPKVYHAQTPQITPAYYPQQPLAIFDNPSLFEKFDTDALFFIFYYQQGTYQQYLAAKELKKQSWRFHKKYLTWFQRHEEPKSITDDYEQGTYIYFDYEGAWCQRKKTEFRFEYCYSIYFFDKVFLCA
ncbi:Not1 N-terminal domain, CCR4-Not complex component-domain-containing protein [Mycotypha africana]|uniref:Not1 N-terminal domain, CCR4-Not complex component-domain-containing protein n=1 Tax=Mycotypha africana TaxID=64632 RepID=UPI002300E342|nr:Not1 N-terminal domain, CCR4-Not complex component-domain-containing protein [Mycotypha africana]KAI8988491.1 Not1 N-terminal domain, CCR4-Not complex component-domain-containing protein [Mycotypha africana]